MENQSLKNQSYEGSFTYGPVAMDHFRSPRNVGILEDADGYAQVGDPDCGDSLTIYIRVENEIITDVRFQVVGCAGAISSGSMATEMIKGKTIPEALRISNDDVVKALGGLPPEKVHCSVMAEEAIVRAIENYKYNMAAMHSGQDHTYPFLQHIFNSCGTCNCGNEEK